ncbi:PEP-CTERM sorting domain-containing protein [Immundisolibacter sp.]|uniref:PEP-CTERM sorting domain-containing protein n=2 Tax=Immundisolibacter sp. TaxID=1934948 RepID=UPI0035696AC6
MVSGLALGIALALPSASMAGAVLTTSTGLEMGVFDDGGLGFSGTGLFFPGIGDAITPGCLCEGWGVAASGSSAYSYAGGSSGFSTAVFTAGATSDAGFSTVTTTSGLTITHTYSATASGNLFKVDVSIMNTSGADVSDLRYARTLDWDVPPGHFSDDFTTIWTGAAGGAPVGNVLHTSFDPFAAPDPLVLRDYVFGGPPNANATDQTGDLGAYFILSFGDLADGASRDFTTYIGFGRTVASLLADFAANGVGAYSYSYDNDGPAAFGWGFGGAGIGVPPIGGTPVPAPATLGLLGAGLIGLAALRRRQAA